MTVFVSKLLACLSDTAGSGAAIEPCHSTPAALRASALRQQALAALAQDCPDYLKQTRWLHEIWKAFPQACWVGDSTQLTYAGNSWLHALRPGHWFNSATGYGTLGYALPAAIGAWLGKCARRTEEQAGEPLNAPVISVMGDGGLQFTLPELGCAAELQADVVFLVWNNRGYQEIETSMQSRAVHPVGVSIS